MNCMMLAFLLAAPPAEDYWTAVHKASASGDFLITWVGRVPEVRLEKSVTATADRLDGFTAGSVAISGPWHNQRHVNYAVLSNPTRKELEAALKDAKATWAAESGVSRPAVPFESKAADGSGTLPVGSYEALDEVNALRARHGMRPFIRDDGLTIAAARCAAHRAANRIEGHTSNDFAFLPSGCHADAAGCAAWPVGLGWGSCCCFDDYRYAGAAYVAVGGVRFMHLHVRR